jgi:hypothetical protein
MSAPREVPFSAVFVTSEADPDQLPPAALNVTVHVRAHCAFTALLEDTGVASSNAIPDSSFQPAKMYPFLAGAAGISVPTDAPSATLFDIFALEPAQLPPFESNVTVHTRAHCAVTSVFAVTAVALVNAAPASSQPLNS